MIVISLVLGVCAYLSICWIRLKDERKIHKDYHNKTILNIVCDDFQSILSLFKKTESKKKTEEVIIKPVMKRRNSASVIKESDGKGNNKLLRVNSTRNSLSSSILHQIEYDIVGSHGLSNSTDLSPLSSSHADSKSIRRVILLYL